MFKSVKVNLSLLILITFILHIHGYTEILKQETTKTLPKESNDNEIQQYIKNVDTSEATGYNLFYFDGKILRDEQWRFDRLTGATAVNHRHGFLNEQTNKFYLYETYENGDERSFSSTILNVDLIDDVIAEHVDEPILRRDMNSKIMYKYITLANKFKSKSTLTSPTPEITTITPEALDNEILVPTDLPSNCKITKTGAVICRRINPNALKSLLG